MSQKSLVDDNISWATNALLVVYVLLSVVSKMNIMVNASSALKLKTKERITTQWKRCETFNEYIVKMIIQPITFSSRIPHLTKFADYLIPMKNRFNVCFTMYYLAVVHTSPPARPVYQIIHPVGSLDPPKSNGDVFASFTFRMSLCKMLVLIYRR